MKTLKLLMFFFLFIGFISCEKNKSGKENSYVFIKPYCDMVTVGGVVGIREKCFNSGDTVSGRVITDGQIAIRIAAHSELNEGPPGPHSYQEFLNVPAEYLKKIKERN